LILVKDFDPLGIVFVVEKSDILVDQFHGGLIDSAMEGDRSVPVNFTSGTNAEEVREVFRERASGGEGVGCIGPMVFLFVVP